jgi:hypothetical protein
MFSLGAVGKKSFFYSLSLYFSECNHPRSPRAFRIQILSQRKENKCNHLLPLHVIAITVVTFVVEDRVSANLFVILLQSGQVLTRLNELAFFHAFAHIPMDKCALRE